MRVIISNGSDLLTIISALYLIVLIFFIIRAAVLNINSFIPHSYTTVEAFVITISSSITYITLTDNIIYKVKVKLYSFIYLVLKSFITK